MFSTLDADSGHWQIELDQADIIKTAFVTHKGLYRYTRLLYGLNNALATFQRAMNIILAPVKSQHALVYLDDVDIFCKSLKEHLQHVESIPHFMQKAGMTFKLKSFFFFSDAANYLEQMRRPRRLSIATKTTNAVRSLYHPTAMSELRSLFGPCNVYG